MKKIILWSVVLVLVAGLAAGAFWWLRRPQFMVFDNGAKLTVLAVDYGKHHAAPPGNGKSFTTTNDELVVWVRKDHNPGDYLNTQYFLYDASGAACVPSVGRSGTTGTFQQAVEVQGIRFNAFPRRQGKVYLGFQYMIPGEGWTPADQKLALRNPARGSFPKWTAEPLPATKDDNDLSVTLTKLAAGVPMPFNRGGSDDDDAMNKGVQAVLHVERNGGDADNWRPVSVETSDATGNHVTGTVRQTDRQGGDETVVFQYGLWPDEAAWKVRFEFSQQSDFADDESWAVQNIPFQPGRRAELIGPAARRPAQTGPPAAEADVNGVHVKIFPVKEFTDVRGNQNPQAGLFIQTQPPLPPGMRLTIVKLTDNEANDIQHGDYNPPGASPANFAYGLNDVAGLTNLNLTIALHKSRFAEFTVKPETDSEAAP